VRGAGVPITPVVDESPEVGAIKRDAANTGNADRVNVASTHKLIEQSRADAEV
jgi:hypothetical protein